MSAMISRDQPITRIGAALLVLALLGLTVTAVGGCKLFAKKATTEEPKTPGGSKGKVSLGGVTQPAEPSQPSEPEKARLKIKAGDSSAQGAAFKLFDETGSLVEAGQIPATARANADTRHKLVVSKSGFRPWEAWQTLGNPQSVTEVEVVLQRIEPRRVTVTICTVSERRATRYCPTTRQKTFSPSAIPGYCTVHGPRKAEVLVTLCTKSHRRATRYCPHTVSRRVPEGKVPGYCTIHTGPQRAQTVPVRLCSVSKKRATRYCPSTIVRRFAPDEVPGYCTIHGPRLSEAGAGSDSSSRQGAQATKVCPNCGAVNRIRAARCKNCRYHFD